LLGGGAVGGPAAFRKVAGKLYFKGAVNSNFLNLTKNREKFWF